MPLVGAVGIELQPDPFSGNVGVQLPVPTCLDLAAGIQGSVPYPAFSPSTLMQYQLPGYGKYIQWMLW